MYNIYNIIEVSEDRIIPRNYVVGGSKAGDIRTADVSRDTFTNRRKFKTGRMVPYDLF